jgi:hypothetical protein
MLRTYPAENSVQDLLLSSLTYEVAMIRKRGDVLIGFLSLADIVVLIAMSTWHSTGVENILIYTFDTLLHSSHLVFAEE